jgi:hypothetical protein
MRVRLARLQKRAYGRAVRYRFDEVQLDASKRELRVAGVVPQPKAHEGASGGAEVAPLDVSLHSGRQSLDGSPASIPVGFTQQMKRNWLHEAQAEHAPSAPQCVAPRHFETHGSSVRVTYEVVRAMQELGH